VLDRVRRAKRDDVRTHDWQYFLHAYQQSGRGCDPTRHATR